MLLSNSLEETMQCILWAHGRCFHRQIWKGQVTPGPPIRLQEIGLHCLRAVSTGAAVLIGQNVVLGSPGPGKE